MCQQYGINTNFRLDSTSAVLTINGNVITIPYDLSSNLPDTCTESNIGNYIKAYSTEHKLFHEELDNLSHQQQKLLRWHRILGHMGFHKIQAMARKGLLPKSPSVDPVNLVNRSEVLCLQMVEDHPFLRTSFVQVV